MALFADTEYDKANDTVVEVIVGIGGIAEQIGTVGYVVGSSVAEFSTVPIVED